MKEVTGGNGRMKSVITRGKVVTAGSGGKTVDADVEIKLPEKEPEPEKTEEK